MKTTLRGSGEIACAGVLAGMCLLASQFAQAQSKADDAGLMAKRVKFTAAHLAMAEMIAIWSQQAGCPVAIDDEPLRKEADIRADGTAQEVLEQIARAFDYDWTRRKSGVILMRKAFHDPKEAPQTNLPEMRQMAKQAIAVLSAFPCDPARYSDTAQARQLFKTFSPDQLAHLQAGRHLRAADLQPQQADLLQQVIVNKVFAGAVGDWQRLLDMLNAVPTAHVQVSEGNGNYFFSYRWLTPANLEGLELLTLWKQEGQRP